MGFALKTTNQKTSQGRKGCSVLSWLPASWALITVGLECCPSHAPAAQLVRTCFWCSHTGGEYPEQTMPKLDLSAWTLVSSEVLD